MDILYPRDKRKTDMDEDIILKEHTVCASNFGRKYLIFSYTRRYDITLTWRETIMEYLNQMKTEETVIDR